MILCDKCYPNSEAARTELHLVLNRAYKEKLDLRAVQFEYYRLFELPPGSNIPMEGYRAFVRVADEKTTIAAPGS